MGGRAEIKRRNGCRSKQPPGADLGETLIRAGHAHECPHFSGDRYARIDETAREAGRDLSEPYAASISERNSWVRSSESPSTRSCIIRSHRQNRATTVATR